MAHSTNSRITLHILDIANITQNPTTTYYDVSLSLAQINVGIPYSVPCLTCFDVPNGFCKLSFQLQKFLNLQHLNH